MPDAECQPAHLPFNLACSPLSKYLCELPFKDGETEVAWGQS